MRNSGRRQSRSIMANSSRLRTSIVPVYSVPGDTSVLVVGSSSISLLE
jgi:hypothetical protein